MALTRPALRGVLLAALVLFGVTAIKAVAQPLESVPGAPLPFDPGVRRGTLGNGLEYYLRRNTEPANRAQLWLAVQAGSVLEEDDQRGVARFVARMAFRGTARFSPQQISDYLESIGSRPDPDQHVQTGYDATVFHLEVAADAIDAGVEMLSEWAYAVAFSPDQTARERALMLDRWGVGDDAATRIRDHQLPHLFGDSRYSERLPTGRREVIERASPELLRTFYDRWYRPDLMAVIAVGDFAPDTVEAAVRRHFGPPPAGAVGPVRARGGEPAVRPRFVVPDHADPRVNVVTDAGAEATRIEIYRKARADTRADLAGSSNRLAQQLITGMLNTRLSERTAAGGALRTAAAGRRRLVGESEAVVVIGLVDPDGVERGLQVLLDELQGVREAGFTADEVERESAVLMGAMADAYERRDRRPSRRLADQYLRHFLEGQPVPGIERERELHRLLLPEMTLAELNRLAQVSLPSGDTDNTVLLVSGPEEIVTDSGAAATDATLAARLRERLAAGGVTRAADGSTDGNADASAGLLTSVPDRGRITAEQYVEEIGVRQWTLSNGVTVIAKRTALNHDEVLFHATSPGGTSLVDDADFVPALTAADLIGNSGAGAHDRAALEELLADRTVAVTPYIAELFEGFSGSAAPRDLETAFQLIYLYATRPRVDGGFYAAYASHLRTQARERGDHPDAAFSDALRVALSRSHFRARPVTPQLLEELSLERAVQVYADRFADFGDFTFLFVGAFDWQVLRALSETYLASLPASARAERWADVGIDPPPGIEDHAVRRGAAGRSTTRLVFAGDMEWSRGEALALAALGEVLELRLRERLRDDPQAVYGGGVNTDSQLIPDPEYRLIVGFDCDPERADEVRDAVLAEVAWLHAGGERPYLEAALKHAIGVLRSTREERTGHNRFWLDEVAAAVRRDEPLAVIARVPELLEALTVEQLAAAARRYLTPDRYVRVVLLPEDAATQTGA